MRRRLETVFAIAAVVAGCGAPAGTSIAASIPTGRTSPAPTQRVPVATAGSPTASPGQSGSQPSGWMAAAPMLTGRIGFDAVVLGDGTVLAVGDDSACIPGGAFQGSERADVYDPTTDTWTEAESLNKPRKSFATVALSDGTALVAGGVNTDDVPFSSTWVFDPSTHTWRSGGLLGEARGDPAMTALSDGRALIVGGWGAGDQRYLSTAELYDPASSSWTRTGSLPHEVSVTEVVGLGGGGAVALGYDSTDSEPQRTTYVFDAASGTWTRADWVPNVYGFEVVPVGDSGALAFGGNNGGELEGGDGSVVDWVNQFDSGSGRWQARAPMSTPRMDAQAASLGDGRVLVAGGAVRSEGLSGALTSTAEVFDLSTDRWTAAGDLLEPRQEGLAVALQDGSVLLLGGNASFNTEGDTPFCPQPLDSVERFYTGL